MERRKGWKFPGIAAAAAVAGVAGAVATLSRRAIGLGLGIVVATVFLSAFPSAAAQPDPTQLARLNATQLETLNGLPRFAGIKVDHRGVPTFIQADLGSFRTDAAQQSGDARELLRNLSSVLKADGSEALQLRRANRDAGHGLLHYRMKQLINGLEVAGGEVILHVEESTAQIISIDAQFLPGTGLPRSPSFAGPQAIEQALQSIGARGTKVISPPRLAYATSADAKGHLVWRTAVQYSGPSGERRFDDLLVDATSGTLVRRLPRRAQQSSGVHSCLDLDNGIVTREWSHAVHCAAANLFDQGESGALNQSFSDIFWTVAKAAVTGVTPETWVIGDDASAPASSDEALRYLNDPARDGQSHDHYSELLPADATQNAAGISNLAFYLLANGGSHPRQSDHSQFKPSPVTGIGIEEAARIFYYTLRDRLLPDDGYAAASFKTTQTAIELYGPGSRQQLSTCAAWSAVGVPTHPDCSQDGGVTLAAPAAQDPVLLLATCNYTLRLPYLYAGHYDGLDVTPAKTVVTKAGLEAQCLLARTASRGFNRSPGPIDGVFGPMSQAAARDFQSYANSHGRRAPGSSPLPLAVDGSVGPKTWPYLRWLSWIQEL